MRPRRGIAASGVLLLGLSLTSAISAAAQSVRVTGTTSLRYVEVRPLAFDSLPAGEVEGTELLRQTADGRVMRCALEDDFCRGTRAADPVSTLPLFQDLEVSVWGLGQGIRAFAHLRGRTGWGGNPELWPRAADEFDLLLGYGELDRERYRVRVGRQWQVSGLGFYNFDGLSTIGRPRADLTIEAYAGRSLVRGLNEARTDGALAAIETLAPEEPGLLLGAQARYRPAPGVAFGALYHRDIRLDRGGLYAELAAADGVVRVGEGSVEGAVELDVASGALNEARLRLRAPPFRRVAMNAEVRRYRPYFELWTIWGAFAPVGFDEGRLSVTTARAAGSILLRGEASYRSYEETGMTGAFGLFRRNGWGLGASANWSPSRAWRLEGGYRVEAGFGAARSEWHAGVVRQLGDRGFVAARALGFQRIYEFRLEEGTVIGAGADGSFDLSDRTRLVGSVTRYQHVFAGDAPGMDWNQLRGSLLLRWTVGAEPEAPTNAGGAR